MKLVEEKPPRREYVPAPSDEGKPTEIEPKLESEHLPEDLSASETESTPPEASESSPVNSADSELSSESGVRQQNESPGNPADATDGDSKG